MRTSLTIFRSFIRVGETGELDASQVLSRDCYLTWLEHRKQWEAPKEAKRFQRTLSNHLSGVDGRTPFPPEEEAAILLVVRRKVRWPCFPLDVSVGFTGFRSLGFHEKSSSKGAGRFKHRIEGLDGKKQQNGEFALNFATKALEYAQSLTEYNHLGYIHLCNLLRYVLFARTSACLLKQPATLDCARELCKSTSRRNPNSIVTVMSLTSTNFTEEYVLAQNRLAYEHFGDLQVRQRSELPFPLVDVFNVMLAKCTALLNPGLEIPVQRVRFNGMVPNQTYSGTYCMDSASYLLILCTKPSLPPSPSST
ncbi:hypothetical protein BASA81_013281 [Batrachochytrium salamandrivorans]|nr:hypothetical protein BASA81_013281 [Batrachochytrium salamandrivorans]